MTADKPIGFKYSKRQATIQEIESTGFKIEPETKFTDMMVQSPVTGAYYEVSDFTVSQSATVNEIRVFGQFIELESDSPMAERFFSDLENPTVNLTYGY